MRIQWNKNHIKNEIAADLADKIEKKKSSNGKQKSEL